MLTPSSRLLGARRSLLALAESLDPERWRPIVCAQTSSQLGEALAQRQIPLNIVKLGWWRKGKYFLWRPFAISRLAALARSIKADLIHCNEIYPNPYAVRASQNVPAPAGSPCEGQHIPVVTHVRLGLKEGMIHKYDLHRADRIVVPSVSLSHDFDKMDDKASKVSVIYNGVNLQEFRRTRTQEAARMQLGLPVDGPILAAIGQLGHRKGGDIILKAFARLAPQFPKLHLIFVGDPHRGQEDFAEELKARAAQPPLTGRVMFFSFTEKILPYYEAIDINLLISRDEGFGRTIIEAGAVGIPSIGANIGGIAEIIVDGVSGRLIPSEDSWALTEALGQMLENDPMRREMGESAFRRCAQDFSIAAHTRQMMDLFDEVLERKASAL